MGDTQSGQERHSAGGVRARHVAAVAAGNALAFYDFLTYGYFAIYIGNTFFPSTDKTVSLLASLAAFGVGFLTRPIGAIVIGAWADRVGRKPAMIFSFALLGAAVLCLALTPSYAQIGIAAPIIAVGLRLIQGFALGAEVGPTTAYLVEAASPERRGFYTSLAAATQDAAAIVAGVVGVLLALSFNTQQLNDWGWRIAMLIGTAIIPFGLMLRTSLPETFARDTATSTNRSPVRERVPLRPYFALIVLGLLMLIATTIGSYTMSYMTTYAIDTLAMPAAISFGVTIVNGVFFVLFEPASGWLSDKLGRKPVMIYPGILLLIAILPGFWIIAEYRTALALYGVIAVLTTLSALTATPAVVVIAEQVPAQIRSGFVATVYAFAISIFGGSTQFVVKGLLTWTHDPLSPAYYWTVATAVGLIAMILVRESAPGHERKPKR
jgi:MFS transporter, MHS family, citrate/tricarballylate:H+ symporter